MTPVLSSLDEHLETSFEDGDLEYVDGELIRHNAGEVDHGTIQILIGAWFVARRKQFGIHAMTDVRTRVTPTRYRLPDVTVAIGPKPAGRIITEPPFLVVEILSPEDRASRLEAKIDDYMRFGIRFVWVIDPRTGRGHVYSAERRIPVENGIFWTEDPRIEMNFADLQD